MISKNPTPPATARRSERLTFFPWLSAETISKLDLYHEGTERNEVTVETALPSPLQHQRNCRNSSQHLCSPHPIPHGTAILSSSYNNSLLPPAFPAADLQHQGDPNFFLPSLMLKSISAAVPSPLARLREISLLETQIAEHTCNRLCPFWWYLHL